MVGRNSHKCTCGYVLIGFCITAALACIYWLMGGEPGGADAHVSAARTDAVQIPEQLTTKQYKILHVMSYHSPWQWTDAQLKGFQVAMKGCSVDYKVMQMDTKRKSDEAWKQEVGRKICDVIDQWKPDLVYTSDDNAQIYVTQRYINSGIPFVFSAVNEDPQAYGFIGAKNITGVLERMHYAATMRLLKKLVPGVRKVAVLTDTGRMWPPMIERMKKQADQFDGIEVVSYDIIDTFERFKEKVREYQGTVDAFGLLGIFEFKDENGNNVAQEQVFDWIRQNSKIPDFSFYEDRVARGTLCAVTVSAYDQGYQAGLLAKKILVDGVSPSLLPITATEKGVPAINLECARRLNITPSADVLLTAKVIQNVLKD